MTKKLSQNAVAFFFLVILEEISAYDLQKRYGGFSMFIYSVRASSLRFFTVIVLTLALLVGIVLFARNEASAYTAATEVDFSGIKTNEDRLNFISKFVSGVSGEPRETETFSVPENFDRIMLSYNEIQKSQGLDITKYKNKKVTRYTYELENWGDEGTPVFINLVVHRNKIIACDISSQDPAGFVKPLVNIY